MNWLQVWGPSILAALVGVVGAAVFTLLFSVQTERQRRKGVKALVTQELVHNLARLEAMRQALEAFLKGRPADRQRSLAVVRALAQVPGWQRSRWDLPDVGVAFTVLELTQFSLWYAKLDDLPTFYGWLLARLEYREHGMDSDEYLRQVIAVHEYITTLIAEAPAPLDLRLGTDPELRKYLDDLAKEPRTDPVGAAAPDGSQMARQPTGG